MTMINNKAALLGQERQPFCDKFSSAHVVNKWVYAFLGHALLIVGGLSGLVLLPALLLSPRLQETFFAFFYKLCQRLWERSFANVRRILLARIDDMVSHSQPLRARSTIRVLEVGAAYGPNLQFVRRPVEYWKLEPNTQFDALFLKNVAANPKVQLERAICGYGEDMSVLPDGYFDVVLMTYVLCSAKNGRNVLDECKRVLAKGGILLFSEHVGHPKESLARFFEDFFTPFTRNLTCGCHLNRDTANLIKNSGFPNLEIQEIDLDIPFLFSRQIYGVATA